MTNLKTPILQIAEIYKEWKNIDRYNSEQAVTQTLALLSAGNYSGAFGYTGTAPESIKMSDGILITRPNIKREIYATVYVDFSDTYNIHYVEVSADGAKIIKKQNDIYLDQLARSYEVMYDDFIMDEQDGFIEIGE
jgi:hypothetical protein